MFITGLRSTDTVGRDPTYITLFILVKVRFITITSEVSWGLIVEIKSTLGRSGVRLERGDGGRVTEREVPTTSVSPTLVVEFDTRWSGSPSLYIFSQFVLVNIVSPGKECWGPVLFKREGRV